ncbi:hypothetical protein PCANC_09530 [Puccinia coronata f. sp. avenae]|uniref:Iron-sulfur assembly protein 1 n=1 Tax=Puccinia coronata f. sp. avenae TaxID=200324 RepID=A0A2N5V516_9BASI|nr:hypothetical protein PCANC_09530 [Puccinia coronata f. sp. avenae]
MANYCRTTKSEQQPLTTTTAVNRNMTFSIPTSSIMRTQKLIQPASLSAIRFSRATRSIPTYLSSTIHQGQLPHIPANRSSHPASHRSSHSQPATHQHPSDLTLNQPRPLDQANTTQSNLKLAPSSLTQPVDLSHQDLLINSIPIPYTLSSSSTTTTITSSKVTSPPSASSSSEEFQNQQQRETTTGTKTSNQPTPAKTAAPQTTRTARTSKPAKQVINLTPKAIDHLSALLEGPNPKLIRIGVKNKGCAGMAYNLDYVDQPGKFDEVVVTKNQHGHEIKVLIDSRALFSIIGSTMDWQESKLGNKFVFDNPNIKEECGCGESFLV